jgi:signal transduction histidine kinase
MLPPACKLFFERWHWLLFFLLAAAACAHATDLTTTNSASGYRTLEATNHLGQWIWETNTFDKQTVRFWKKLTVPGGSKISRAVLRITVDNGYTLFFDGQEIGRGSDWRTITDYDVTQLLSAGPHVLAIEAFNDRLEGGLIFGLQIDLADGRTMGAVSDESWFIVPAEVKNWFAKKTAPVGSHPAIIIGPIYHHPWETWPIGLATVPPVQPVVVHFWQTGWFQLLLFLTCAVAVLFCIWLTTRLVAQSKAQQFLQLERARIARDIHDDLGAQLTQLVLLGEVAQREQPEDSAARRQFHELCQHARDLSQAMDEVVWAVNSRRDTVRDFASYMCKYAQLFFNPTATRCRLDVEPEIPATEFELPVRRNLFLAVKEALNNAAKHAQADELFLRIYRQEQKLVVAIEDNGIGFDPGGLPAERNGLTNMTQRMAEIGGACDVVSQPGLGCRITFTVPLKPAEPPLGFGWLHRQTAATTMKTQIENLSLPPELVDMNDKKEQ